MRPGVANWLAGGCSAKFLLDIGERWSVLLAMDPPSDLPDATNAENALFALILLVAERVLDLAASADREARLAELSGLSADLDLFAQTAVRLAAYTPGGALIQPV